VIPRPLRGPGLNGARQTSATAARWVFIFVVVGEASSYLCARGAAALRSLFLGLKGLRCKFLSARIINCSFACRWVAAATAARSSGWAGDVAGSCARVRVCVTLFV
jgi:hypothetical protein